MPKSASLFSSVVILMSIQYLSMVLHFPSQNVSGGYTVCVSWEKYLFITCTCIVIWLSSLSGCKNLYIMCALFLWLDYMADECQGCTCAHSTTGRKLSRGCWGTDTWFKIFSPIHSMFCFVEGLVWFGFWDRVSYSSGREWPWASVLLPLHIHPVVPDD